MVFMVVCSVASCNALPGEFALRAVCYKQCVESLCDQKLRLEQANSFSKSLNVSRDVPLCATTLFYYRRTLSSAI